MTRSNLKIIWLLLLFSLGWLTQSGLAADAFSWPARLAAESLLLDGQAAGDALIVVGDRGHILRSTDQGASWQQMPVPTRATLTAVFFVDDQRGWAVGHDQVILGTSDGGISWSRLYEDIADERPLLDLLFLDDGRGFAVGAYGLFLQTDDWGVNWQIKPFSIEGDHLSREDVPHQGGDTSAEAGEVDYHLNRIVESADGRIYIAGEAGHIYRSDDGCRSWAELPSPYEGSFFGILPLARERLLLYGLRGHLFLSDDAGENWQQIETATEATLSAGLQLRDGRILVVGMAGTLLVSTDGGRSFEPSFQEDRAGIAALLAAADGSLVLIGEAGVRRLVR